MPLRELYDKGILKLSLIHISIIINGEKAMKEAINIFEICDGVVTIYRKNAANT